MAEFFISQKSESSARCVTQFFSLLKSKHPELSNYWLSYIEYIQSQQPR